MKLGKKLRHLWHDVYYKGAGPKRIDFAMTCRDVVHHVDVNDRPHGPVGRIRFWLHLSVCQTCKSYFEFTYFIRRQIRKILGAEASPEEIRKLNEKLLVKYQKTK